MTQNLIWNENNTTKNIIAECDFGVGKYVIGYSPTPDGDVQYYYKYKNYRKKLYKIANYTSYNLKQPIHSNDKHSTINEYKKICEKHFFNNYRDENIKLFKTIMNKM